MVDDIEMARPKGLLIPFDKFVILDILPPEQYKNVLTKMRQYVEHGKEPEGLEDLEKMAFESLRSSMDTNIETYRRSIFANRKNGRKGGRPRKATETDGIAEEPTETHGFSEKPTKTDGGLKYKVQSTTDTKVSDSSSAEALPPTTKNRFSPPDVETVKSYFAEKGGTETQAIRFHASRPPLNLRSPEDNTNHRNHHPDLPASCPDSNGGYPAIGMKQKRRMPRATGRSWQAARQRKPKMQRIFWQTQPGEGR